MGLKPFLRERENGDEIIKINPMKRLTSDFWLPASGPTAPNGIVTLAPAGTPGDTLRVPYVIDGRGHYEITAIMLSEENFNQTGVFPNVTVKIFDPGSNKHLHPTDREIHIGTIAGTAQQQGLFSDSYFMENEKGTRTLDVTFRNLSNQQVVLEMNFFGRRWYSNEATPDQQRAMRKYGATKTANNKPQLYFLTTQEPIILPAGGSTRGLWLEQWFTAFELAKTTAIASEDLGGGNLVAAAPQFNFQIRELRNQRTMSSVLLPASAGWGSPQFPFFWSDKYLLEQNRAVRIDLVSTSQNDQEIFLTGIGRRLYYESA